MSRDRSDRGAGPDGPDEESHLVQVIVLALLGAIMSVLIAWPLAFLLVRVWSWLW